jgi:hypothetical protein
MCRSHMTIAARAGLADYDRAWLRPDVTAGTTLAAYLLPADLGDASLAGLPPEAGLCACLFAGLGFWLFCSSRHAAITVTSAISLIVGSSLGAIDGDDPTRHAVRRVHGAPGGRSGFRGLSHPRRRRRQLLLEDHARRLQERRRAVSDGILGQWRTAAAGKQPIVPA